jgi:hypothetical protein
MHAEEFKLLSAISAFCLMGLISLAVASFVYTNTQDHLLQQASNQNLSSDHFQLTSNQFATNSTAKNQLISRNSSMV